MRQTLVVGNWKMHGSRASVASLLGSVVGSVPAGGAEVAVCPSYVHLPQAVEACAGSNVAVGAQDCSHMQSGAYTGEVSAEMLVDQGCRWVILGHSERRQYHSESDNLVAAKLGAAVAAGLQAIVCVGETREQRESGEEEACCSQPVARSTGRTAEPYRPGSRLRAGMGYRHRSDGQSGAGPGHARFHSQVPGGCERHRCGCGPGFVRWQRKGRERGGIICTAGYRRRSCRGRST